MAGSLIYIRAKSVKRTERDATVWCGLPGATSPTPSEYSMPAKKHGMIIETLTEARQAELGPSILLLLISTGLPVIIMAGVWFAFFRT